MVCMFNTWIYVGSCTKESIVPTCHQRLDFSRIAIIEKMLKILASWLWWYTVLASKKTTHPTHLFRKVLVPCRPLLPKCRPFPWAPMKRKPNGPRLSQTSCRKWVDTVDGRNPGMYKTLQITGQTDKLSINWCRISSINSTTPRSAHKRTNST